MDLHHAQTFKQVGQDNTTFAHRLNITCRSGVSMARQTQFLERPQAKSNLTPWPEGTERLAPCLSRQQPGYSSEFVQNSIPPSIIGFKFS